MSGVFFVWNYFRLHVCKKSDFLFPINRQLSDENVNYTLRTNSCAVSCFTTITCSPFSINPLSDVAS